MQRPSRSWLLASLVAPGLPFIANLPAAAQLTPDATLGSESTFITPGVELPSGVAELIEGGAMRGGNLFHSFLEFNIDEGQRVYFANPAGIESILTRVTGGNPSNLFGTLGVDGAADLFLINPNGIVFGENVALDIQGSFYASTAEAIPLGDGVYSATAPEQSSLLTVNPSALFSSYLSDASGDIENRGQLAAGENLTLAGNNLDLQGQVAAGRDLTLLGNAVQIRDTTAVPFVGFAGGDLLVQGNEAVDIVALSHADSGLYSYGNMVLRSANPVGGDAHYWSSGSFRVENLDTSLGELFSPIDPIIRALGDVFIEDYLGSSLHILAGGSVTIGTAEITAPDPGTVEIDFLQETITLSDGIVVQIDGAVQPTLDVRAGVTPVALGTPPLENLTGFNPFTDAFFGEAFTTETPSTADITVGDVFIAAPNGLVLLTNQYQPNTALAGGNIVVTGEGIYGNGIDARGFGGQGGAVYLDARNDVLVTNSFINTTGLGQVGDIVINAGETVRFDGTDGSRSTGAFANIASGGEGTGGNVRINAANLEVLNGAQINSLILGNGQGGNITFNIVGLARFVGSNPLNSSASGAFSSIVPNGVGSGGDVQITAGSLEVLNGAELNAASFGQGEAGSVILVVKGVARFAGTDPIDGSPSTANSSIQPTGVGQGGNVQITADSLEVLNGAQLGAGTLGQGDAGNVVLVVEGLARFDGTNPIDGSASGAFSRITRTGIGRGGDVQITAGSLEVLNGAVLDASTFGQGDAGSVVLVVEGLAHFAGSELIDGRPSGAFSRITRTGIGRGGDVQITAGSLEVLNGAVLEASTFGQGDAGSVVLVVEGLARFAGIDPIDGSASGASSSIQPTGVGRGGSVQITAGSMEMLNGSQLGASTLGQGEAGSVVLVVEGLASFVGTNPVDGTPSGVFSNIQPNGVGRGGNVQITADSLEVLDGAGLGAVTFGRGDAGSVVLVVEGLARFVGTDPKGGSVSGANSSIQPNGVGLGGNVQITAGALEVLDGAGLSASTFGQGEAGSIILVIAGIARFAGSNPIDSSPSGAFSSIQPTGVGSGGDVQLTAQNVEVLRGAVLGTASLGRGDAGNILLIVPGQLLVNGGTIGANSETGSGGQVNIQGGDIIFRNDGDIETFVNSGEGGGGNITIAGNFLIALDDSDILAFSADGTGGDIDLSRTTFFGQNPSIAAGQLSREDLLALDGNNRVDINATGGVASGDIAVGDSSFIENSLASLADTIVDTSTLTANSCIARTDESLGSFTITGSGGLPQRPGDSAISAYPTGTVRTVAEPAATLQEPDGVYQLPDGRLVLSRACE
ncbi:MAG: filamentous hemagglutinin N-terminal domain-containing protein [Nodosilinea sp.]